MEPSRRHSHTIIVRDLPTSQYTTERDVSEYVCRHLKNLTSERKNSSPLSAAAEANDDDGHSSQKTDRHNRFKVYFPIPKNLFSAHHGGDRGGDHGGDRGRDQHTEVNLNTKMAELDIHDAKCHDAVVDFADANGTVRHDKRNVLNYKCWLEVICMISRMFLFISDLGQRKLI
jgi:hypothetical protein